VLSLEGALEPPAAESLPLAELEPMPLSLFAGAAAASFMHFSFSAPVNDSQFALLVCPLALLESLVALWLELCANDADENASKADARLAVSNFTFMCGSFSKWNCAAKRASPMPCRQWRSAHFAETFIALTRTNAREAGPRSEIKGERYENRGMHALRLAFVAVPALGAAKLDTASIERIARLKGRTYSEKENVFKVRSPRSDVKVAMASAPITAGAMPRINAFSLFRSVSRWSIG
jgi:hypothetical protein